MKTILTILSLTLTMVAGNQLMAQDQIISADALPAKASSFLKSHFSGEKIAKVEKDTDNTKIEYEVYLNNGMKIEFNEQGDWKEVDGKNKQAIPTKFLDKNLLDYLAKNYPNAKVVKADRDAQDVEVELSNGVELKFDLNGQFLRLD